MASIGHVTVGMAAARIAGDGTRAVALVDGLLVGGILCFDIDVIGLRWASATPILGISRSHATWRCPRGGACNRRGRSRTEAARPTGRARCDRGARQSRAARHHDRWRTWLRAAAADRSHALLRTVAADPRRADRIRFPVDRRALIALVELGLFSLVLVFALWPGRVVAKVILPAFTLGGRHRGDLASEPTRDAIKGKLREDTSYASGFSETAFRTIRPGLTERKSVSCWARRTRVVVLHGAGRSAARRDPQRETGWPNHPASARPRGVSLRRWPVRGPVASLPASPGWTLRERWDSVESCCGSWSPTGVAHRSRQVCHERRGALNRPQGQVAERLRGARRRALARGSVRRF